MRSVFLSVVMVAVLSSSLFGSILVGPVTNPANGHVYYLLNAQDPPPAEPEAISLGGHLATVNDAAENAWLVSTFASTAYNSRIAENSVPWMVIGLNDVVSEGTFAWFGEPSSYTNWAATQPLGSFSDEDYVGISAVTGFGNVIGEWHDIVSNGRFTESFFGVVEIPEPGALSLVATCAVLMLRRSRRVA